ncbi:hypothetical protein BASA82_001078 [Batrachochytrium salamandrivorans]|nr:hypothetical protein BASA82_001078 [Batrachochytrium salamandrivorans]
MSLRLVVLLALCLWLGAMANVNFDDIADDEDLQEIVRYGAFPAPDYQGLIKEIETCGTKCAPGVCVCCTYRCRHNGMLWKKSYCNACPRNEMCTLEEAFGLGEDSCLPPDGIMPNF